MLFKINKMSKTAEHSSDSQVVDGRARAQDSLLSKSKLHNQVLSQYNSQTRRSKAIMNHRKKEINTRIITNRLPKNNSRFFATLKVKEYRYHTQDLFSGSLLSFHKRFSQIK